MGRRADSRQADARPAGNRERALGGPAKQRPIETSFLRIPSRHQDRRDQGGSRQLFRDVTALLPRLPVSVLVATYSTWNPQPNLRTPALPGEGPSGALEPKLPRLLSPWFAPSLDPSIHPSIQPARQPAQSARPASSLPDGLRRAKQGVAGHGGLDLVQCRITHR